MVGRAGLSECIDMAVDWGERHHPDLVDADTAGPGHDGCLWFRDRLVGRSGRPWPGFMVLGTGLVGCADFLDSVDLLPMGRSIRDQPDFMGVDFTALWPRWIPCSSSLTGFVPARKASRYVSRRAVALRSNLIQLANYYSTYRSLKGVLFFARAFLSSTKQILKRKLGASSVDCLLRSIVTTHWHGHHRNRSAVITFVHLSIILLD
jgi:hypothetical protein